MRIYVFLKPPAWKQFRTMLQLCAICDIVSTCCMKYGLYSPAAAIAQLGERQTEDLKVPGSIPGLGICPHHDTITPIADLDV